ncbi:MAG: EF-hand domain-containing protein [archaeon]|nr:EF-hand domain-containing protein [archaeon]
MNEDQKQQCTEVFNFLDEEKKGVLNKLQVEYGLGMLGKRLRKKDLEKVAGSGGIDLDNFIEICQNNVDFSQVDNSLINAFKIFDPDNSGFITKKDLATILKSYQPEISKKDIDNITKEANPDSDGKIDYIQFAKDMLAK